MIGKKKRSKRKRGPDGNLYTAEELASRFSDESHPEQAKSTIIKTPEQQTRESQDKPAIQEKSTKRERDSAPTIIISYIGSNGQRNTKSFQCANIKLDEYKVTEMMRSGPKTTLHISVEADVVEVM